ncbi:MAG: hypothetical protein M1828_000442 [Chrysothrix sp. TS-e1954]|nr:MAG: hypothetical protein M1828_000442 [Chrysothrix sp. TS-e1954]
MVVMQCLLLRVALLNRAFPDSAKELTTPFAGQQSGSGRPYDFWQWRSARPYWQFLAYFTLALCVLQVLVGQYELYVTAIGYLALAIEATLPVPQIMSNHRKRSCKGFRLSVLVNWLLGDVMKMSFFFLSQSTIPWSFKLCGLFQFGCDMYLGVQYLQFGE